MLGQAEQTPCMADQPCADKFAHKSGQIGGNGIHAITQILRQLRTIRCNGDHLVAERMDVCNIGIRYLGAHADFRSDF